MNLYNEDEKKDGAPVIPSGASPFKKTSAFGKPMFSRTAGGIMERLKNLSRKDMAFVGIGLSVLVMAPVAEYMTSKPSADNLLTPGFGSREGSAATGGVYEPGINALSQGSPDGSGEVITPLSSRDPSSLILGSQPAQPVMPAVTAPPPSSGFRDSMKDVGRNAFSEVTKSAGIPTPIPRMASALRNFGSFFSGGEGTRTTGGTDGKIIGDAKSASSKAAGHGMIAPVGTAGYRGVASNTPNSSSKGAFEKLRAQADRSASNFSGTSAMNSLDKAASDAIDIGKGTGGLGAGGADSEKTGKPSNSTTKYDHSRSGESLAEIAAKARQQKALDWEFFKKYEIKKQIITAVVGAISTSIGKFVGNAIDDVLNPSSPSPKCWVPSVNLVYLPPPAAAGTHDQAADRENCKKGAVQSPEYFSGAGDKATNAGYTAYCPCGKTVSPAIDAPKGGAPADTGQVAVSGKAAESGFGDFDTILSGILTQTGKAAASPKKKDLVVEAARSVAGGFGEFSNKTDASLNPLRNKVSAADKVRATYGDTLSKFRNKYATTYGKYETLLGQVGTVESGLSKDCTASTVKMQSLGEGKTASLAPKQCEQVKKWITEWKTAAKSSLEVVSGDLDTHGRALGEYQRQIGFVNTGISDIKTKYGEIYSRYGKITPVPGNAVDVGPAVTGLNQMTAQLKENLTDGAAPIAAEATPVKVAMELRALNWDASWKDYKLVADDGIKQREGAKWAQVENGISAGQQTEDTSARDLVSNFMRSDEIISGINGRTPDFEGRIGVNLATLESDMGTLKSNIQSTGIDPAAFGTTAALTTSGGNTSGGNTSGGNTSGGNTSGGNTSAGNTSTGTVAGNTSGGNTSGGNTSGATTPAAVDPDAASADEVVKAKANFAAIKAARRFGVGTKNGAANCSTSDSEQIRSTYNDANRMMGGSITKDEAAALAESAAHACVVLKGCNPTGYAAAGCAGRH